MAKQENKSIQENTETWVTNEERKQWNSFLTKHRVSQCSTILFDLLSTSTFTVYNWDNVHKIKYRVQSFIDTVNLITILGNAEHTGDWDPSISIKLRNSNEILESEPGYYHMEILENENTGTFHLYLEKDEDDEGSIQYHIIDITKIETLLIHR